MSEALQFRLFSSSTPIFVGWTREFSSGKIYRTRLFVGKNFVGQNYSSNIMFVTSPKFLPVSRTSHYFVRGCVVYPSLSVIIINNYRLAWSLTTHMFCGLKDFIPYYGKLRKRSSKCPGLPTLKSPGISKTVNLLIPKL